MAKKKSDKKKPTTEKFKKNLKLSFMDNKWKISTVAMALFFIFVFTTGFNFTGLAVTPSGGGTQSTGPTTVSAKMTFIIDSSCTSCYDVEINEQVLEQYGITVSDKETLDISEAQDLIEKYNITKLPTFLLSEEALDVEDFEDIWLGTAQYGGVGSEESDGILVFREVVAISDPLGQDYLSFEDGDWVLVEFGVVETGDDEMKLMVFLSTNCGWCKKFENEILPSVAEDFGEDFIEPHYTNGPTSEDAKKHVCAGEQGMWLDYALCFNEGSEDCETEVRLDSEAFETCLNTTAENILSVDSLLAAQFGVPGTPAMYINKDGEARRFSGQWTSGTTAEEASNNPADYESFKSGVCEMLDNEHTGCA